MANKDVIYNNLIGFIKALEVAEIITVEQAVKAREYAHRFAYSDPA